MYLDANLAKTVKRKFGKKSEIQLENFIRPEKLNAVHQELKRLVEEYASVDTSWYHIRFICIRTMFIRTLRLINAYLRIL